MCAHRLTCMCHCFTSARAFQRFVGDFVSFFFCGGLGVRVKIAGTAAPVLPFFPCAAPSQRPAVQNMGKGKDPVVSGEYGTALE